MGCVTDNNRFPPSEKLDIDSELPGDSAIVQEVAKVADALKKAGVLKVNIYTLYDGSVAVNPLGGNNNEVKMALDSLAQNLSADGFDSREGPQFYCPDAPLGLVTTPRDRSR